MSADVYEILSLAARYLFALLGVLAVLRAFFWLIRERSVRHGLMRQSPDIGMVGELLVMRGNDEAPAGMVIPVPREGVLGCLRGCDIVVPCSGVSRCHLDFSFEYGTGLVLFPKTGKTVVIDGNEYSGRSECGAMLHGSVLEIGSAMLKLRLFAALNHGDSRSSVPDGNGIPYRDPEQPPYQDPDRIPYQTREQISYQFPEQVPYPLPEQITAQPSEQSPYQSVNRYPSSEQPLPDARHERGSRRGLEDDWGE